MSSSKIVGRKIRFSYAVLVIILCATVGFLTDYIIIDRNVNTCDCPKCESVNNIVDDCSDNDFKVFSNKMREQISSKYNSGDYQYQNVDSSIFNGWYSVKLDKDFNLIINYYDKNTNSIDSRFVDYKIAENVLAFYVVSVGQGGGHYIYFINEDGTVGSANVEYGYVNNGSIEVKNDLGLKNIVSVVGGGFGMDTSGYTEPIFIDIYGNIYQAVR